MKPIISVKNLSKKFQIREKLPYYSLRDSLANLLTGFAKTGRSKENNVFWALKDVSFDVYPGEVLGIIGRNGAGKSTLLKILSQITPPTSGTVTLEGRVASLLEVGTGFHPELTGRENIFLNGAILGMSRKEIKSKFDEIVDFAEIEKFLDTPVKHYSSGMYMRLAFAVAAHLEPEILLVDEVLAVGDTQFQQRCLGKIESITRKGITVLFVSHNIAAVANLCKRSILLDQGKIQCIGSTDKALNKYLNYNSLQGKIQWPIIKNAPGNNKVKIKYIYLLSNENITSNPRIDSDINIEVGYWNLQKDSNIGVVIHLKDSLGTFIFASADMPSANLISNPTFDEKKEIGIYKTTCTIPANTLNDKSYTLDVGIYNYKREMEVDLKDILTFTVVDTGEMRKEYMGDWVGQIRPKLAWKTNFIENL